MFNAAPQTRSPPLMQENKEITNFNGISVEKNFIKESIFKTLLAFWKLFICIVISISLHV